MVEKNRQLTKVTLGGAALVAAGTVVQVLGLGTANCLLGPPASGIVGASVGALLGQAGSFAGGWFSSRFHDRFKELQYELNDPSDVLRNQYLCRLVTQAIALSIRASSSDLDRNDPIRRDLKKLEKIAKSHYLHGLNAAEGHGTESHAGATSVTSLNLSEPQIERFFTGDWDDFGRVDSPSKLQWRVFLTEAAERSEYPVMEEAIGLASSSLELHFAHMLFNNAKNASEDDPAAFASLELMLIRTLAKTLSQHGGHLEDIKESASQTKDQLYEVRRELRELRETLWKIPSQLESRVVIPELRLHDSLRVSARITSSLVPSAVSTLDARIASIETLLEATFKVTSEIRDVVIGDRRLISDLPEIDSIIEDHAGRAWVVCEPPLNGLSGCVATAEHRGKRTIFKVTQSEEYARGFRREVEAATMLQDIQSADARFCRILDSKLPNHRHASGDSAAVLPPYWIQLEYFQEGNLADWWKKADYNAEKRNEIAVELLNQIARTVHLAHELGVLHRDLKPANILMHKNDAGDFMPYISDFGIASFSYPERSMLLQEHASATTIQSSEINPKAHYGTFAYMAPELSFGSAGGRPPALPSVRTEVYSLGVILYWLITRLAEPPSRESVQAHVADRYLGYLIRRATHRDPSKRFKSALEFANALGARETLISELSSLEDELLSDSERLALERDRLQASQEERERADRERNRAELEAARAKSLLHRFRYAVVGLVVLFVLSASGFILASNRAKGESQAKKAATEHLQSATMSLAHIRSLLKTFGNFEEDIRRVEGLTAARDELVTASIGVLEKMQGAGIDEAEFQHEIAGYYLTFGQIARIQNRSTQLLENSLRRACSLYEHLADTSLDREDVHAGLARSHMELASFYTSQARMADAYDHLQLAYRGLDQLDSGKARDRIHVQLMLCDARLSVLKNEHVNAIRVVEQAKDQLFEFLKTGSVIEEGLYADALSIQAEAERSQGHIDKAVEIYQELIRLRSSLSKQHPSDAVLRRRLIVDLHDLGRLHSYDQGDYSLAEKRFESALHHAERLVSADSEDGVSQGYLLDVRGAKVSLLRRMGNYESAIQEAISVIDQAVFYSNSDPENILKMRGVYAQKFGSARAFDAAAKSQATSDTLRQEYIQNAKSMYEEAISGYEDLLLKQGSDAPVSYRTELADIKLQAAKFYEVSYPKNQSSETSKRSMQLYQESISIYEGFEKRYLLDQSHRENYAVACRNLGTIYLNRKDGESAVMMLERADRISERGGWSVYARKSVAHVLVSNCDEATRYARLALADLESVSSHTRMEVETQSMMNQVISHCEGE